MLDLKIIPNINNNSDLYIFFCEKNFSFNSKKLSFIDIDYKEINSLLLKNKDEDYFVFNYHSTKPKKIIFIDIPKILCVIFIKINNFSKTINFASFLINQYWKIFIFK